MLMTRICAVIIQLFLVAGHFHAVSNPQKVDSTATSSSNDLNRQIDSVYKTLYYDDFENAVTKLRQIDQKASESDLWEVQMSALLNIHYCAQYHGQVDTMVQYLEKARSLFNGLTPKIPADIRNKLEQKLRYANGNAAYNFGEYEQAISEFKEIIKFDSLQPVYLYKCLSFIGHSYANLDNYPQAIDYHLQAQQQLPVDKSYHYYRGVSYSYLGISYKKMFELRLDTVLLRNALKHYHTSLDFFSQSSSKNKTGPIGSYTLLSEAYGILGKADSSAYYLEKAQLIDPDHAEIHRFWGMHFNKLEEYEKARDSFLKSNEIIAKTQGAKHFLIGRNLMQIGKQYESENRWLEAIEQYQSAFNYLTMGDQHFNDVFINPNFKDAVSERDFLECLRLKAGALLEWAGADNIKNNQQSLRLSKSIETYELVINMLDEQRTKYVSGRYQQLIGAKALSIYEKAISACHDAVLIGLDSAKYTTLAFRFMEKNKNRQLRDALRVSRNIQYAGIPKSLLEKENELKQKLRFSNRLLFQQKQKTDAQRDIQKIQSLQQKVFDLTNQWEDFDRQMADDYPAYYQLKNGEPVMELKELQSKLGNKKLLLEYFYGDEEAFVFAVTNKDVLFEKLLAVETLNPMIVKSLQKIRKPMQGELPQESFYEELNELKNALFPEQMNIPSNISKLVIVPDGPLGYLPFEILVNSATKPFHFLVEDFNIHYVYSSYLVDDKPETQITELNYLGFAPSYPQSLKKESSLDYEAIGILAHNKAEVKSAQSIFSGSAFLDSASTEDKFKKYAKSADILHLSMHAMINDEIPELSRLIFYQNIQQQADSEIDGNLHLYEIYNESLTAQLTVLSACNTGNGQLRRGEGISSLGSAFRFAGCNSIVMSLWEVNDKHTQFLTNRFFFHLKEGLTKDEALRQAKLDFLKEPAHKYFKHPFYWASLVLIGEPSELLIQKNNLVFTGLMIALFSLIVFIIYRYSRIRKQHSLKLQKFS